MHDLSLTLGALDIASLFTAENALALVTLTLMEIVLGIDNIVFIAVLCGKLPPHQRDKARVIGLALAMITRIALLATIALIVQAANKDLFQIPFLSESHTDANGVVTKGPSMVSGRDIILILGGAFLIFKATKEIHNKLDDTHEAATQVKHATFRNVILQILLIDLVFSLDSVITAVGMARAIPIMVAAVIISVLVMLVASGPISRFVDRHPTIKMLALAFLLLIGVMLVADGMGQHIPKGYIYFAMAFSLLVEMLNLTMSRKKKLASTVTGSSQH